MKPQAQAVLPYEPYYKFKGPLLTLAVEEEPLPENSVLKVLLRKHKAIRDATGVSVPVPDESDSVVEAVLEGLLLREKQIPEQLTLDGIVQARRDALWAEWDSAAERSGSFRTGGTPRSRVRIPARPRAGGRPATADAGWRARVSGLAGRGQGH